MVLVPLVSLAYVHESGPSGTTLSASASALDGAQRIDAFHARASRSAVRQPLDDRAVPATSTSTTSTSTTVAPTTTTVRKAIVTTTTAKPKPTTTTTAKPKPVTTTTAKPPATTTTTAKPPATTTTTAAPAPPASGHQEGDASYHDYADASTCAHRTLPLGTRVTVTNLANGKKTTCIVNDRGPYAGGRILDLSKTGFSAIANVSDGVIHVAIDW